MSYGVWVAFLPNLVQNRGAVGKEREVALVEYLRIGNGQDAKYRFTGVSSGIVDEDGTIFVADARRHAISSYDSGGTHVWTASLEHGRYPSDFLALAAAADTIWALAKQDEGYVLHGLDIHTGKILRTKALQIPTNRRIRSVGFLRGRLALSTSYPTAFTSSDGTRSESTTYEVAAVRNGRLEDSAIVVVVDSTPQRSTVKTRGFRLPSPYAGRVFLLISRDLIYALDGKDGQIRVLDSRGTLVRRHSLIGIGRTFTASEARDRLRQWFYQNRQLITGNDSAWALALPPPAVVYDLEDVVVGTGGTVVMSHFRRSGPGSASNITLVDPRGVVNRGRLPERHTLLAATRSSIVTAAVNPGLKDRIIEPGRPWPLQQVFLWRFRLSPALPVPFVTSLHRPSALAAMRPALDSRLGRPAE